MYLYCISNGAGAVKFGFSKDPVNRLRSLCTGSSTPLTLLHRLKVDPLQVRVLEAQLHLEVGVWRNSSGEWFEIEDCTAVSLLDWFEIRYCI